MPHNYRNQHRKKSIWEKVLIVIVILVVLLIISEFTGLTHFFYKKQPITANSNTKSNSSSAVVKTPPNNQKSPVASSSNSTTVNLITPTGDFVSDHHPNLSGSPAPNSMTSVCNTTPGATCAITFTNNGVTKSLPTVTTDAGGAVYWNWTLQNIGLTVGSWQITAIASLDGQTKTASDALQLVVSQ